MDGSEDFGPNRFIGPVIFMLNIFVSISYRNSLLRKSSLVRSIASVSTALTSVVSSRMGPPVAKRVPQKVYFGVNPLSPEQLRGSNPMEPPKVRIDEYSWLRDDEKKDKEVLSYLNEENKYCLQEMSHLSGLQKEINDEILSHLKETDEELPYQKDSFLYFTKTVEGKAYKIHCRKPVVHADSEVTSTEQVVLDLNEVAAGSDYSDVSAVEPSPDHSIVAYAVDNSGYEVYSLRFQRIDTREHLRDELIEIGDNIEWGADNSAIFYVQLDEEHRPYELWMHVMGTPQEEDTLLLSESDGRFFLGIEKSSSGRFLFVTCESKETSEVYAIDLSGVAGADGHRAAASALGRQCIRGREQGVRYSVEHQGESLYVVTNIDGAKNGKLVRCSVDSVLTSGVSSEWSEVRPYDPEVQIEGVQAFREFMAVFGRQGGFEQIWLVDLSDGCDVEKAFREWRQLSFPEPVYSAWAGDNCHYGASFLRISYSSLLTPRQVLDVDKDTLRPTIRKQQEVPLYEREGYSCCRRLATAEDGTKVPISIVFNNKFSPFFSGRAAEDLSTAVEGTVPRPLLLDGYGSYGSCSDPVFDFKKVALLDRGVVFAIAHVRGGGEMGRQWYEDQGKYLTKKNTFTDFAACARYLVEEGITSPDRLAAVGRSAGGLLMGAMVNMYPSLFRAIVADVPFVDVINSMSDPTIPLTITEWEEWGNPNEETFYEYMASYSPYDNVGQHDHVPALLVTAGLHDSRVAYWEPAKWVAKIRATIKSSNPVLLKTDMSSGHFSASDRYKFIMEAAFEYAFIIDQIAKDSPAAAK